VSGEQLRVRRWTDLGCDKRLLPVQVVQLDKRSDDIPRHQNSIVKLKVMHSRLKRLESVGSDELSSLVKTLHNI